MKDVGVTAIIENAEKAMLPALLFDYVVPGWGGGTIPGEVICPGIDIMSLQSFFYPTFFALKARVNSACRILETSILPDNHLKTLAGSQIAYQTYEFARCKQLRVCAMFDDYFTYSDFRRVGEHSSLEITINNFPIPDSTALSWDQVLEIRSDTDFHKKLRNLRLYIDRQFAHKDSGFIQDCLCKDLEDYEKAAAKHGLKLVKACTKKTLSASTALSALCLASLAALSGQPPTISGLVGLIAPIGSLLIELSEIQTAVQGSIKNPELAYLVDLNRALKKNK